MNKVRLNKFLAEMGIDSRRNIDKMVEEKRIKVNGIIAEQGLKVNEEDKIEIDNKLIKNKKEEKVYYILNKPQNVICAVKDTRKRRIVTKYIKTNLRIYPVGRLDYETEGLIFLTNDGEFTNKILHPKNKIYKTYYAELKGNLSKNSLEKLINGVKLEDGMTMPAKVKVLESNEEKTSIEISISEGKNRQIRRMCEEVGNKVLFLKRLSIGKISLGNIKIGEYRNLRKEEINYIMNL